MNIRVERISNVAEFVFVDSNEWGYYRDTNGHNWSETGHYHAIDTQFVISRYTERCAHCNKPCPEYWKIELLRKMMETPCAV